MKNKKLIKTIKDVYNINGLNYYCAYVYFDPYGMLTCVEMYPIRCDSLYSFRKIPKNYIYMYTKKKITRDTLAPYIEDIEG